MGVEKIFSFTSWDSDHPRDRHPGDRLDAQFDAHANAIRALEARLAGILRPDGKINADLLVPPSKSAASNADNVELFAAATAEDWADVSIAWAEYMPDTIPGNILAWTGVTGDHWSSRWWANQAALVVGGGASVASWNGRAGIVTMTVTDITAAGGAVLASPVFTGTPAAPTPAPGNSGTALATTAFVATSFAPLASPVFTGDPQAPTQALADNDTSIANTAFVTAKLAGALAAYAPLASPVFTGDPQVPTAAVGDNDTSIASTAFVTAKVAGAITLLNISSGVYTPVLTNGANVAASTAYAVPWVRISDRVIVAMRLDVDPTANNTNTTLDFTLPVATAMAGSPDLSGACVGGTFNVAYHATAAGSLNKGSITAFPPGLVNHAVTGLVMYRVM